MKDKRDKLLLAAEQSHSELESICHEVSELLVSVTRLAKSVS